MQSTLAGVSSPPPRSRGRWAVVVIGLALILGTLEAAQGRFQYANIPSRQYWPEAFARSLPSWLILAALFPIVQALARRFPVQAHRWHTSVPLHLVCGTAFVLVHLGGAAWVAALRHVTASSFQQALSSFVNKYAVTDYFVYGALVGIVQIAAQRSEMQRREQIEARLRADLAEARLAVLRNQLNPHFLFNTLNSISALALTGDRTTLVRTVDSLSRLLRIVLAESGAATTTLAAEMEFLDRYAEIQAVRFGERLTFEREVDPATLAARVPALILQPLVENAITHGVGRRPGPGWVAIRARREPHWLRLEVADSGPGFASTVETRAVETAPAAGLGATRAGVGLANTRARLDQLYGAAYQLECKNAPGGGAHVVLRIPWSSTLASVATGGAA